MANQSNDSTRTPKGDPDAMTTDAPGTGAKAVGGVNTATGAGEGEQRAGGTSGVETEKSTGEEGVASGGSIAAAMNDAHVHAADNAQQDEGQ